MTVNQRIQELLEHLGFNPNSFSKELGLKNNSTISRIVKGQTNPSFETLSMIGAKYDWLNMRWLILGEGEMIKEIIVNSEEHTNEVEELNERIKFMKETIEALNLAIREKYKK